MSLLFTRLQVPARQLSSIVQWYGEKIGMSVARQFDNSVWLAFPGESKSARVELEAVDGNAVYQPRRNDVYWKIGLAMADVRLGQQKLESQSVHVGRPNQFRDIGFLCHTSDPSGYTIELLQHQFEQNFDKDYATSLQDPERPLGQKAIVGQITLRVRDIEASLRFYTETLGMKLLSRQEIPDLFDLYFLADTTDVPPNADVNGVENREWCWQRDYTTLELQHFPDADVEMKMPPDDQLGFRAMGVRMSKAKFESLAEKREAVHDAKYAAHVIHVSDPDGTPIIVVEEDA